MDISGIRKEYTTRGLRRQDLLSDPMAQFDGWFQESVRCGVIEPNAMILGTHGMDGFPASRVVLLKGVVGRELHFFTNYDSDKGHELDADDRASLTFFWPELERQVRIQGRCSRVSHEVSDRYFQSRPRLSQVGAWVSDQSRIIPDRKFLEDRLVDEEKKWEGRDVERPPHWGGYAMSPFTFEFWQGREGRLHDRFRYTHPGDQEANPDAWIIHRLSP